jgi:hypothetical protein
MAVFSVIFFGATIYYCPEISAYEYVVRSGDTLSEITLMFTGTHDYQRVARQNGIANPDLIHPGDPISLSSSRPVAALKGYLSAIYEAEAVTAYKLLSTCTRSRISFGDFKKSLAEITFYNLDTIFICADFLANDNHILQLKIRFSEDPASWGFSMIREKYRWYVLLFDLNPTNPQDDGSIEWRCD